MKKRTHLYTNFIKFIFEKYKEDVQDLPDEKETTTNKTLADEFEEIINDDKKPNKLNDKDSKKASKNDDENDEDIDTLIKEYLSLEKKYKSKRNASLFNRK